MTMHPDVTISIRLRPEYIAAVKACCARMERELEELDRLLAHIEVEADAPASTEPRG